MKAKNLFLIVALFVMGLTACTTPNVEPEESGYKNLKRYKVCLSCAGELDVTQQPLTRYTPTGNDLYGISVTYKPASATSKKQYAFGLFDDISNVELELIEEHDYYITAYMIVDGKNVLYSDSTLIDNTLYRCFAQPFLTKASKMSAVTNQFTYSEEECFQSWNIITMKKAGASSATANSIGIESYYGYSGEFTPTADGETVSLFMKRMTWGVKFVAGDFLKEGKLRISMKDNVSPTYFSCTSYITPEDRVCEETFAYWSPSDWYSKENLLDAKNDISVDISWIKDEETTIALKTKTITINRLKQTIVNINMYEDDVLGDGKLSFSFEDIDITESDTNQYTFGENQDEYKW